VIARQVEGPVGGLPGTGGQVLCVLVAGVLLLLGGGGVLVANRRRN
jgi:hypothetical protein